MLTIESLRNSTRKSGFDRVQRHPDERRTKRYRGQAGLKRNPNDDGWVHEWRGPWRQRPEEAAQDYCDYVNSGQAQPMLALRRPGHTGRRKRCADPEVEAALGVLRDAKGQREGRQGYVYLIIENLPGGRIHFGKIGYSTNPHARVAELQTGNPRDLRLLYMKPGTLADERALHQKFIRNNKSNEWFEITKDMILDGWDAEHAVREDTPA